MKVNYITLKLVILTLLIFVSQNLSYANNNRIFLSLNYENISESKKSRNQQKLYKTYTKINSLIKQEKNLLNNPLITEEAKQIRKAHVQLKLASLYKKIAYLLYLYPQIVKNTSYFHIETPNVIYGGMFSNDKFVNLENKHYHQTYIAAFFRHSLKETKAVKLEYEVKLTYGGIENYSILGYENSVIYTRYKNNHYKQNILGFILNNINNEMTRSINYRYAYGKNIKNLLFLIEIYSSLHINKIHSLTCKSKTSIIYKIYNSDKEGSYISFNLSTIHEYTKFLRYRQTDSGISFGIWIYS